MGYGAQLEQDNRPDHSPINPEASYLCIEVMDSGIGIPKERWHLLFRPFQQIDSSYTRKHEGTGLGLALTKRLVELHGGSMSFNSALKQGSVFRIWLPARYQEGSDPTEQRA
jgi:signal transduction histidine kinase